MDFNQIGEPVREKYRRQGEERLRNNLVEALNKDALVITLVPLSVLEHIIKVVEETK